MSGSRGFRRIPYALIDELRALPPAQRLVLLSIVFLAEWEAGTRDVDGVPVRLDIGEALVSLRGLAATLALGDGARGMSLVRRSLAAGVRIGLISTRPARPKGGTPSGTPRGTPPGTPRDAPPTLVRFLRHRAVAWPAPERGTPRDAPPGTQGGTIPVVQEITRAGELPSPAARARARRADAKASDPRHAPLTERLAATFAEVRGTSYGHGGGRDAKAIADLLRLSGGDAEEVDRRWRRALDLGPKWPGCATFAALALRWNDLAPLAEPHLGVAPASRHVEGFLDVGAVLAKRGRP